MSTGTLIFLIAIAAMIAMHMRGHGGHGGHGGGGHGGHGGGGRGGCGGHGHDDRARDEEQGPAKPQAETPSPRPAPDGGAHRGHAPA